MKFIEVSLATLLVGACGGGATDEPCGAGNACVWAGTGDRGFNNNDPTAPPLEAKLFFPEDLTFDGDNRAYIADWNNHRVRRVEFDNSLVTVVGTDYEGDGPPEMEDRLPLCNPAGALGTTVAMNHMTDVEIGPDGRVYIAAWHNNKIRVLDPATGIVTSIAGNSYGYAGDGTPACNAVFNQPKSIAFGSDGTLYTIDQRNLRIRAIDPVTSVIRTVAGVGQQGNLGDGGQAMEAQFGFDIGTTPQPTGSLVVAGNYIYIADTLNNRIRRIALDTGIIDCIAGSAEPGYTGDGGSALQAQLNFPTDIELGPDGRLYVADRQNHVIRAIDLTTNIIETVAGTGAKCDVGEEACSDGVLATEMRLNEPYGVAFDRDGDMFIADTHNHRILTVPR